MEQPQIRTKEEMNAEIVRRIKIMEAPDYDAGPGMTRADTTAMVILAVVCIVGMFIGYWA